MKHDGWEDDQIPRNVCGYCLTRSTRANPVRPVREGYWANLCAKCRGVARMPETEARALWGDR